MACIDTCGSIGVYANMLVEDSITTEPCPVATFDSSSERYEFLSENIRYTDTVLGGNGLTGGIDPIYEHLRNGTRMVFGRILMEVGPAQLDNWLPRILGNDGSGTTFTTDEVFDLKPFDIMLKRDLATVIYRRCSVNRAMLRARASIEGDEQVMQMALDIIGYEEHDSSYPSPPPPLPSATELYWLLGDGELTVDGTEYYFDAFNLMVDNNLVPQTRNFLHITCLQSRGRKIQIQISTPYTAASHTALYPISTGGIPLDGVKGSITLDFQGSKNIQPATDGVGYVTTILMPNCYQTRQTPNVRGPGDIPLSLDFQAYRVGTTEPITITNDSTLQ